jgi:hypothetical protein
LLLGVLIVGLGGLGSYGIERSRPSAPNLPVERICPERFAIVRGTSEGAIPLCLNVSSLGTIDPAIERAIIVLHGAGRNAPSSYDAIVEMLRDAGQQNTLVVAPQFLTEIDVNGRDSRDRRADLTYWRSGIWSQGDRADGASAGDRPSSFEVLDRLVEEIARPGRYPNLKEITIAGHSAGAQFVQRYAAGSRIEEQRSVAARSITFKYVVANPSSYLYLFPRPVDRTIQDCPRFDEYKYGLRNLNAYLQPVGADAIRAAYPNKDVTILLGRQDYQQIDPSMDAACPAMAQGANRLSRGLRFVQHLDANYGPGGHHTRAILVPGVGHNARGMFTSAEGRAALLGQ